jgi:hypothetical protein
MNVKSQKDKAKKIAERQFYRRFPISLLFFLFCGYLSWLRFKSKLDHVRFCGGIGNCGKFELKTEAIAEVKAAFRILYNRIRGLQWRGKWLAVAIYHVMWVPR